MNKALDDLEKKYSLPIPQPLQNNFLNNTTSWCRLNPIGCGRQAMTETLFLIMTYSAVIFLVGCRSYRCQPHKIQRYFPHYEYRREDGIRFFLGQTRDCGIVWPWVKNNITPRSKSDRLVIAPSIMCMKCVFVDTKIIRIDKRSTLSCSLGQQSIEVFNFGPAVVRPCITMRYHQFVD